MSSLVVGGVAIPVAANGSISRPRADMTDRERALDGTYHASQTGNPKRDWLFSTVPLQRGLADYYETVLGVVGAQSCYGDIIGSNQLTAPDDITNAAWTKTNLTAVGGANDPFGGSRATTLTATAANGSLQQFLANGASLIRTNSVYMRRRTGTGTIDFYNPLDAGSTAPVLTAGWVRYSNTGTASVLRKFEIIVRTSGDAIDIYGPELEDGATAGTYSTAAVASCCSEITGWKPVKTPAGHMVVLDFTLHEV